MLTECGCVRVREARLKGPPSEAHVTPCHCMPLVPTQRSEELCVCERVCVCVRVCVCECVRV